MFISPISFTGTTKYIYPADATKQEINEEFKRSYSARQNGIKVPEYKGFMTG